MSARSVGPRFLPSNGTMHQATRLSLAKRETSAVFGCPWEWTNENRARIRPMQVNQTSLMNWTSPEEWNLAQKLLYRSWRAGSVRDCRNLLQILRSLTLPARQEHRPRSRHAVSA